MAVNGTQVNGTLMEDGREVKEILEKEENYPINLRFCRPRMTTNEKIFLASMFYPLFAIASQLSPEPKSSGIEILESDTFRLHCFQTLTGVKFMVVAEPIQVVSNSSYIVHITIINYIFTDWSGSAVKENL